MHHGNEWGSVSGCVGLHKLSRVLPFTPGCPQRCSQPTRLSSWRRAERHSRPVPRSGARERQRTARRISPAQSTATRSAAALPWPRHPTMREEEQLDEEDGAATVNLLESGGGGARPPRRCVLLRDGGGGQPNMSISNQTISSHPTKREYSLRPKNNDVLEFKICPKKNDVLLNLACVHVHVGMQQLISTWYGK
jgi:hypothetical protein